MNKTQEQILARIEERKSEDFLGFEVDEYFPYLDYSHVKPFLNKDTTEKEWEDSCKELVEKGLRQRMIDYMPFAWEKANDCRGISANRSLMHYQAWLWLDGDETLWPTLFDNYQHYGKESLIRICEYLGIDYKQWDNGKRVNSEE